MQRLENLGNDPALLAKLRHDYHYLGDQTCAADGMCSTVCPVSSKHILLYILI